ncbi:MaoC/PaaZ C-terminal domain-containing protein [soil metagenome]
MPRLADLRVGARVAEQRETLDQARLLRYAGASCDFNRLHWDTEFAARVSPTGGVVAHGMLNLGILSGVVTAWAGGPERVRSLRATFRAACPVGAVVSYGAEVVALDEAANTATLSVWAELPTGQRVIDRRTSRAVVSLD